MADAEVLPAAPGNICTSANVRLKPDPSRTVLRPFSPEYPEPYANPAKSRATVIIERLLTLDDAMLKLAIQRLNDLLETRHRNMRTILMRRFAELEDRVPAGMTLSDDQKLLIGGVFSEEYAFEAAALFNPSIVAHWDQSGLNEGDVRFIASLRGIGEGHVSSVTFRTGVWAADSSVTVDTPSVYSEPPIIESMDSDPDQAALCLRFDDIEDISEAVLFPMAPSQKQGIEDLRLVHFTDDDGTTSYVGTYTAFSGAAIRQELLTTSDFRRFQMRPLTGKVAENKGMALFPHRIDGRYAMLGRQDSENISLMCSDDLHHWDTAEKLIGPHYPWEFVQMGNCGSPIEIDEGWLVMIHGVGLVRNYTIGACLLDRKDPSKLLGRTRWPLLRPDPEHRDGYVPNVVYSCGSLVEGRRLLLPYGVADNFSAFATVDIETILQQME